MLQNVILIRINKNRHIYKVVYKYTYQLETQGIFKVKIYNNKTLNNPNPLIFYKVFNLLTNDRYLKIVFLMNMLNLTKEQVL